MKKNPIRRPSEGGKKGRPSSKSHSSQLSDSSERMNPFLLREKMKSRKRMPGSNVLREIQQLQQKTENILPLATFHRLVREICEEQFEETFRWTTDSLKALQTSAEDYMAGLFEDAYLCSMHCKRVTLLSQDLQLARRIRGIADPGNR